MKFDVNHAIRTAKSVVTANSPVLLVGAAVAGTISTGILAARAGYRARNIIDVAQSESLEPLTKTDKFKLTWLCYMPATLTGVTTIASVVGVHTIHTKRHAALAGLYAMTATKMDDYKDKAEELLTPKKQQELNDHMAQIAVDKNGFENNEVILTDGGNELCYDDFSGRYFMSSYNKIEAAVNEINKRLAQDGDASLNEFYDKLGISPIAMGENMGWSGILLEPKFGSALTPDGRPAIMISFRDEPKPDLGG